MPIRVLHIIQGRHFGGAEQVVLTLAKCFDPRNVTASVLCLSDGLLISKLKDANLAGFHIPMKAKVNIIVPLIKTVRLIRKEKIDIVHTHTVRSNLIGRLAALFSGRKCITHLHSPVSRDFADLRRGRFNEFVDSITRPIASLYIAVSNSLRDEMINQGMHQDKIVTVHNALDLESMNLHQYENAGIREEYNIPKNAFVMVMVALLRPRKGPDLLIRAMKKILEFRNDAFLLIIGNDDISEEPGYGNKLREMSVDFGIHDHVIFAGFRNDIYSILRECDLFVLPSRFGEGLPMVMLEAMAAGVPVVASEVEGVPEVVEDTVNGFLVRPGDVSHLADTIIKIMKDPALQKITMAARELVFKNHNGHEQARKIELIYKQILS